MLRAMGGPGLKNIGPCHLYIAVPADKTSDRPKIFDTGASEIPVFLGMLKNHSKRLSNLIARHGQSGDILSMPDSFQQFTANRGDCVPTSGGNISNLFYDKLPPVHDPGG